MKIAFFELEGWEEPILRREFPDDTLYLSGEILNLQTLPSESDFDIISVFAGSDVSDKVISGFPSLKLITTRSTGYDHVDFKAARKYGAEVAYVPGYGDNTVAEYAFGLILALTRNIYFAIDRIKETGDFSTNGLRGVDIKGKTLGVIGTGRIGKEVIKIARGFSMEVVAFDPYPDASCASALGFRYHTLAEVLAAADVLTIHCPANKDTFHLINSGNIKLMRRGTYLVNTARGSIVETEALVSALQDGRLRGAALDVLEEEGDVKDELSFLAGGHPNKDELKTVLLGHVLMRMPNVLVSPHNAFNSDEAVRRILDTTIQNIKSFAKGAPYNLAP